LLLGSLHTALARRCFRPLAANAVDVFRPSAVVRMLIAWCGVSRSNRYADVMYVPLSPKSAFDALFKIAGSSFSLVAQKVLSGISVLNLRF
jgi:hypothetical protein